MRVLGYRRIAAAVMAGVLILAACGDDDDDAATTTAPPGDDTTTTAGDGGEPSTIVVGHAYADLAAFADINPAFAIGDPEEQAQSVIDRWETEGLIPEGIEIQLVQRAFDSIDRDDQAAVCQAFAEEDQVDVLLVGRLGNDVTECAASRFSIPALNVDAAPASLYESAAPYAFGIRADESRTARNFVAWADEEGLLEDKTIGVYYDARSSEAYEALTDELDSRGYAVASEVESTGVGVGSDQDQLAVQRLQADNADLAIMMVGSSSVGNFQNFADQQGYTPEYIDFEYASHMSDTATLALSASQYDGTRAVTTSRLGELGEGLSEQAQLCADTWESFTGKEYPTAPPETGESSNVLMTCDLFTIFLEALNNAVEAGGEIDAAAMVAGFEAIEDLELAYWDRVSYSEEMHTGTHTQREVVFDASCQCFNIAGDFEEFEI